MDKDLLGLMTDYLPAWVISITILILVILFLFKRVRETFSGLTIFKWFRRKKLTMTDLNNHQFFVFVEYMKNYKINRMDYGDPGRTKVFRDYFQLRCQIFHQKIKLLITEEFVKYGPNEMRIKIFDALYTSISETNKLILEQCDNDEERFVVNYLIEKFAIHTDSSIEAFKEVIETVFDSTFTYSNNIERINAALNILLFVVVSMFAESEKVLHRINGAISGKYYKGLKLQ